MNAWIRRRLGTGSEHASREPRFALGGAVYQRIVSTPIEQDPLAPALRGRP